jgi:hypothetical protein
MEKKRNVYRVMVGEPEINIPLERPGRRWEDNTELNIREIILGGMSWIHLA